MFVWSRCIVCARSTSASITAEWLGPEMKSMIRVAALAGTIGPLLFGSVVLALTFFEYDFMRSLGWEPLGFSNTDWPSGLALGQYGWVMSFAFLLNGLLVVVFSLGLWQVLPHE